MITSKRKRKAITMMQVLESNSITFDGIYATKEATTYLNYDHIYRDFEWNTQDVLVIPFKG